MTPGARAATGSPTPKVAHALLPLVLLAGCSRDGGREVLVGHRDVRRRGAPAGPTIREGEANPPLRLRPRAGEGGSMQTATRFLRRDPVDVTPWAETCGQIRCLIEEKDGAAGEVHHVQIQHAKLHYHERTDEFYYVISGKGSMLLDGAEVELHPGVVVYVPRGVRHKARGDLTVLVVCVPPGVLGDVHEVE